jgi:hypothetical protein
LKEVGKEGRKGDEGRGSIWAVEVRVGHVLTQPFNHVIRTVTMRTKDPDDSDDECREWWEVRRGKEIKDMIKRKFVTSFSSKLPP